MSRVPECLFPGKCDFLVHTSLSFPSLLLSPSLPSPLPSLPLFFPLLTKCSASKPPSVPHVHRRRRAGVVLLRPPPHGQLHVRQLMTSSTCQLMTSPHNFLMSTASSRQRMTSSTDHKREKKKDTCCKHRTFHIVE